MAQYKDLREFIEKLEDEDELVRVKAEVDWKYEVSGWIRKSLEMKPYGPALLFENIKGYAGQRLFSAGLSSYSRIANSNGAP